MANRLNDEWLAELLAKTDIVRVVSRYLPLSRKGDRHWGCCPFHHEKEPSFTVSESRQTYYCFGCKESGNVIGFIMKMESVDFIDAVKILAEEAHMEFPKNFVKSDKEGMSREHRDRLYALMRDAAKHYHENLSGPRAARAREYLDARGITGGLVTRFGFGVSYNYEEMIDYLLGKGYTHAEMKEVGLIEQRADGYYDVFYGRLMIPIINQFGEVVAFGGRLINPETHIPIKYRNSTNTPIFDKSKTLYGINLVKRKKQREGIKYVIIAEGYMDVISLHKAGFDTAVASMGTALTFHQAKLIRNYTNNVFISYDGDSAGQTAALRGLDILAEAGLNVKVVTLPDGLDPDDLIKERGRDAYQELLDNALTLPAFKLESIKKSHDLNTPDGKSKYAIAAMRVIKSLENPVEQEEYLSIVHKATGYPYSVLRKQADLADPEEKTPVRRNQPEPEPESDGVKRNKSERFVVASIAHGCEYVNFEDDIEPYLTNDVDRAVYKYALQRFKEGGVPSVSVLYSVFDRNDIAEIADYEFVEGDNEAKYNMCLADMKRKHMIARKAVLAEEYNRTKSVDALKEMTSIETALRTLRNGGENDY